MLPRIVAALLLELCVYRPNTLDIAAIDITACSSQPEGLRLPHNRRWSSAAHRLPATESRPKPRSNHLYPTFPHAVVIVLDQLNAKVEMSGVAWQEIASGLNHAEGESDIYFYLPSKNGTLFPIHGLLPDSWTEAAATTFRASEILPLFEEMRHPEIHTSASS